MEKAAQLAGLVKGTNSIEANSSSASPHPILIVLEPEAAALYCRTMNSKLGLSIGSCVTVVDCGGGTVDLVVSKCSNVAVSLSFYQCWSHKNIV